uniref:Uncharacterized protein n=1 Tax=Arundo donax TaxID=35708 RepID=A0A0A8Y3D6_ARUDO
MFVCLAKLGSVGKDCFSWLSKTGQETSIPFLLSSQYANRQPWMSSSVHVTKVIYSWRSSSLVQSSVQKTNGECIHKL